LLQPNYGYQSNTISAIDVDGFNNIWFCFLPDTAGSGGISYYDGSSFYNFLPGSPQINVNDVFVDGENNKWFATSEGFLMYDALNNSTAFRTYNSLITSNNTQSCIRDLNGNVWITTNGAGLNKYKPTQ
jgi:ligand-binding sensor domain-containing protein